MRILQMSSQVLHPLPAVAVLQLTGVIHLPFLAWLSGGVREAAEDGPKVIPSESIDPPAATEYLQAQGVLFLPGKGKRLRGTAEGVSPCERRKCL